MESVLSRCQSVSFRQPGWFLLLAGLVLEVFFFFSLQPSFTSSEGDSELLLFTLPFVNLVGFREFLMLFLVIYLPA